MSATSFERSLAEMREFATFSPATQRYIRRSLDVALHRGNAVERWARSETEAVEIQEQARMYRKLEPIRDCVADGLELDMVECLMGRLVTLSLFDLANDKLTDFASFRFLYERLLGSAVRPWLPAAYCAACAMPTLHPDRRRALLSSIQGPDATAPGWSCHEPSFFPEWVEKVSDAVEQQ